MRYRGTTIACACTDGKGNGGSCPLYAEFSDPFCLKHLFLKPLNWPIWCFLSNLYWGTMWKSFNWIIARKEQTQFWMKPKFFIWDIIFEVSNLVYKFSFLIKLEGNCYLTRREFKRCHVILMGVANLRVITL